ncbi:hypothetical protein [Leucobacter sp. PH1c]|uniref:hypothetical protein n=1 Tax=Leucobacter sp. PH1c TaxID=1397278 RepID=UPI0012FE8D94|nr:hypothetical protein [Leucobacter sp. PH1c]
MNPFRLSTRRRPPAARARSARPGAGAAPRAAAPVPPPGVVVPWRVTERSPSGVIEVAHVGHAPLTSVRFALAGRGMLGLSLPQTVHPGERVRVVLRGVHAEAAAQAPDGMLVLRWFQADGTELLWPIAL